MNEHAMNFWQLKRIDVHGRYARTKLMQADTLKYTHHIFLFLHPHRRGYSLWAHQAYIVVFNSQFPFCQRQFKCKLVWLSQSCQKPAVHLLLRKHLKILSNGEKGLWLEFYSSHLNKLVYCLLNHRKQFLASTWKETLTDNKSDLQHILYGTHMFSALKQCHTFLNFWQTILFTISFFPLWISVKHGTISKSLGFENWWSGKI